MPSLPKNKKIALVVPWFGANIPGGAESATREIVIRLKDYFEIEVLTTGVKDFHHDWNKNDWKPGNYQEMGVTVRRFPVRKRDTQRFDEINARLINNQPISEEEETLFIQEMIRSLDLNEFLQNNRQNYDWFIYIPYMFGTTYDGSQITREKSIIIPCLHNESYAYLGIYKTMMNLVGKVFFHVPSEKKLAEKIFGYNQDKFFVVGSGVNELPPIIPGQFKKNHKLDKYILYVGRKDSTKNVPELVSFFDRYERDTDSKLKLVLIGPGQVDLPKNNHIIDLGFVSPQEKYEAMTDALSLCQPSLNESFSIVMMESWLCGKPVLVSGHCQATVDHCTASNGGLYYYDYYTFAESLNYLQKEKKIATKMAQLGKEYVLHNYLWSNVIKNYLTHLHV